MTAADELRALTAAATPGPWERCGGGDSCGEPIYGDDRCGSHGRRNPLLSMIWKHGSDDVWPPAHAPDPYRNPNPADAALIVWLVNHAQAIADLLTAADALVQPAGWWKGVEQRQEHQLLDRRAVVRDALAALGADR